MAKTTSRTKSKNISKSSPGRKPSGRRSPPAPKFVQVGFRKYTLKPAPKDADYLGICIFERSEIQTKQDMHDEEKKTTLFHEYCHARMHDLGLSHMFTARQEEAICDFFGFAEMELVRDNWKLLEWARAREDTILPPYKVTPGTNYPGEH